MFSLYYIEGILIQSCYTLLIVLGLSILTGYTGRFSFGHAGFVCIGAYVSVICTMAFGLPYWLSLILAGLVAMLLGAGYGYNILELRTEIGHILGVDEGHRLVVVGAGHLGHALLRNFDFAQAGFLLDTAFDVSPALIGTRVNNVLIRSFDELGDYFAVCHPDVAVLTVPKTIAQEVAEQLISLGVRGIWNFTNTELNVGSEVFTEDVHFADSLLTLSYRISETSAEAEEEGGSS